MKKIHRSLIGFVTGLILMFSIWIPAAAAGAEASPDDARQFGSLTVSLRTSGESAGRSDVFDITVSFSSYEGIKAPAGLKAGPDGYSLALADGEAVTFSNIPVDPAAPVTYSITGKLTDAQARSGWMAAAPVAGLITGTAGINVTIENINTTASIDGAIDDPNQTGETGIAGASDKLPQTGGISSATLSGLAGLALIAAGCTLFAISRKRGSGSF